MAATLRADELHVVLLEHAAVGKLDRQIERGLSAHGRQDGKARRRGRHLALDANNLFQIFAGQRLDVSAVGDLRIGHDGGRIRIGQHHFKALGLERLASLRPGVIKLRRLANDDGARADDQDFRDVSSSWHQFLVAPASCRLSGGRPARPSGRRDGGATTTPSTPPSSSQNP